MLSNTAAPVRCEHLPLDISLHPDAELLAFGQLWEVAGAEVEAMKGQGAAPQQVEDAIMRKMALESAISRVPCTSLEGARVLIKVALAGANIELGEELDVHWSLVKRALAALVTDVLRAHLDAQGCQETQQPALVLTNQLADVLRRLEALESIALVKREAPPRPKEPGKTYSAEARQQVMDLHATGMKPAAIAKVTGISRATVYRIIGKQ